MANETLLSMTRSTEVLTGTELLETIVGGASRTITVDQIIARMNLASLPITFQDKGAVTNQVSIPMGTTNIMRMRLTADNTTISITDVPVGAGKSLQATLIIGQGIGSRLVTWDPKIIWPGKRAPVLSYEANSEDFVTLLAVGTDNKLYGFFNGGNFNV